jgi:metal-responsive CopG/Arc/MetJ family transcriptional regulator
MDTQISLRLETLLLERVDEWCAKQPLKPTRTQAIRSFVEQALDRDTGLERVDQNSPTYLHAQSR